MSEITMGSAKSGVSKRVYWDSVGTGHSLELKRYSKCAQDKKSSCRPTARICPLSSVGFHAVSSGGSAVAEPTTTKLFLQHLISQKHCRPWSYWELINETTWFWMRDYHPIHFFLLILLLHSRFWHMHLWLLDVILVLYSLKLPQKHSHSYPNYKNHPHCPMQPSVFEHHLYWMHNEQLLPPLQLVSHKNTKSCSCKCSGEHVTWIRLIQSHLSSRQYLTKISFRSRASSCVISSRIIIQSTMVSMFRGCVHPWTSSKEAHLTCLMVCTQNTELILLTIDFTSSIFILGMNKTQRSHWRAFFLI